MVRRAPRHGGGPRYVLLSCLCGGHRRLGLGQAILEPPGQGVPRASVGRSCRVRAVASLQAPGPRPHLPDALLSLLGWPPSCPGWGHWAPRSPPARFPGTGPDGPAGLGSHIPSRSGVGRGGPLERVTLRPPPAEGLSQGPGRSGVQAWGSPATWTVHSPWLQRRVWTLLPPPACRDMTQSPVEPVRNVPEPWCQRPGVALG